MDKFPRNRSFPECSYYKCFASLAADMKARSCRVEPNKQTWTPVIKGGSPIFPDGNRLKAEVNTNNIPAGGFRVMLQAMGCTSVRCERVVTGYNSGWFSIWEQWSSLTRELLLCLIFPTVHGLTCSGNSASSTFPVSLNATGLTRSTLTSENRRPFLVGESSCEWLRQMEESLRHSEVRISLEGKPKGIYTDWRTLPI